MLQCWVDPERRPSVQKLESTLMSLMSGRSVPCLTSGGNLKQETELPDPQGLFIAFLSNFTSGANQVSDKCIVD